MSRFERQKPIDVGHLPYVYLEQQRAIAQIAEKLGVVVFRPDYHRAKGDKNTVLLYTKEDAAHNVEVDKISKNSITYTASGAEDRPYFIDDKYIYRDHFWCFENTDVNGLLNYHFANFGKIDLRGHKWYANLERAITAAYKAKVNPTDPEAEEVEEEEKEYHVKVTSITHLYVTAKSEDEAIEKACGEAWEHDADELNGEIIEEENEE